jgi:hypothetical protein
MNDFDFDFEFEFVVDEQCYNQTYLQSLVDCHNAESPYAAPARRRYLRQIASAAELFPWSDLGMDLTPEQLTITRQWLEKNGFQLNPLVEK